MTDSLVAFYHYDRIGHAPAGCAPVASERASQEAAPPCAPAGNKLPLLVRKRPGGVATIPTVYRLCDGSTGMFPHGTQVDNDERIF
jgi:hypothetical protein